MFVRQLAFIEDGDNDRFNPIQRNFFLVKYFGKCIIQPLRYIAPLNKAYDQPSEPTALWRLKSVSTVQSSTSFGGSKDTAI